MMSEIKRVPLWMWVALGLGLILLLAMMTWANFNYLRAPKYVHRDFMSIWGGGRALIEGLDPYDPEVWSPLRTRYGSKWLPDPRNPFPLWTLILALPFSSLEFGWGAALWLTTSQAFMAVCIFLLAIVLGARKPGTIEFALIALGAFSFRGTLVTMHNGQIIIVLLLTLSLFLAFMKKGNPFLAGICLSFILLKPNPFILLAPALALWLLWQKQWRVIWGGLAGLAAMLLVSWIVIPGWLFEWLSAADKTIATFITPTVWGLAGVINIDYAPLLGLLFAVVVTAFVGWFIFSTRERDIISVTAVALAGSILITPYAWEYEHALLVLPLVLFVTRVPYRWIAILLWVFIILVLPWAAYRVAGRYDSAVPEMIVPFVTLLLVSGTFLLAKMKRPVVDSANETSHL